MTYHPVSHNGTNGNKDKRYTIDQEFTGHESGKPQFVLRFCGDFVASSISQSSMVMRAIGHKAIMNGAEVITEVRGA